MSVNEDKNNKGGKWKEHLFQAVIILAAVVTIAAGLHSMTGGG